MLSGSRARNEDVANKSEVALGASSASPAFAQINSFEGAIHKHIYKMLSAVVAVMWSMWSTTREEPR